jgi:hypothetical protein
MNNGSKGAVIRRITKLSLSDGKILTTMMIGIKAARISCGIYWLKYGSRASIPSIINVDSSPLFSPPV